jgi:hypothetical protein
MSGYCSVQKGGIGCMVASDADCLESDVCRVGLKCVEYNGRCEHGDPEAAVAAPGDPEAAVAAPEDAAAEAPSPEAP